jgi:hypothetical protein
VVADFGSGLVSAGMPGSGFMMLTGGIDAADGKSYFDDSGVATGPGAGAGGVEAVVNTPPAVSATGVAALCARAAHSTPWRST